MVCHGHKFRLFTLWEAQYVTIYSPCIGVTVYMRPTPSGKEFFLFYPPGMGTRGAVSRARFFHWSAFTPLIKSHTGNAISAIAIGSAK